MSKVILDKEACIKCNICVESCPYSIIGLDKSSFPELSQEGEAVCNFCGACEAFCPKSAITLDFQLQEEKQSYKASINEEQISSYLKARRSVRRFKDIAVEKEKLERLMETVRYAPTGMNLQQVKWIMIYDTNELRKLTGLAVDWMRALANSDSPVKEAFRAELIVKAWESGIDNICRSAPHLLIACTPTDGMASSNDGIIALSYFDAALPAFGLGGFWAGFFTVASMNWQALQSALQIPEGYKVSYAIAFGYPKYTVHNIPRRNPLSISWR